jgi:hypothetical protein
VLIVWEGLVGLCGQVIVYATGVLGFRNNGIIGTFEVVIDARGNESTRRRTVKLSACLVLAM